MRAFSFLVLLALGTLALGCGEANQDKTTDTNDDATNDSSPGADRRADPDPDEVSSSSARHYGAWRITRMQGESVPADKTTGIVFRPDGAVLLIDNGGREVALGAYIWDANVKPQRIQLVLEGTRSGTNFLANFTPKGELVLIEVSDPAELIPSIDGQIAAGSSLESLRNTIVMERDDNLLKTKEVAAYVVALDAVARGEKPPQAPDSLVIPAEISDVVPVSGTVTLNGEPLSGAMVSFLPVGPVKGPRGGPIRRIASGMTDASGNFSLTYQRVPRTRRGARPGVLPEPLAGAPAGDYQVIVQKPPGGEQRATDLSRVVMSLYEGSPAHASTVPSEGSDPPVSQEDSVIGIENVTVGDDGVTVALEF